MSRSSLVIRDFFISNSKIPPEVIDTCSIVLEPRLNVTGLNLCCQNSLLSQIHDLDPGRCYKLEQTLLWLLVLLQMIQFVSRDIPIDILVLDKAD